MIYIIIGTRGQFVKMFPVMKLFNEHQIDYRFVSTGQHHQFIEKHYRKFCVRQPDIYLSDKKRDLSSFKEGVLWAVKALWRARRLPIKKDDFVIIHGNAESAVLAWLVAKWFRAKIVHVEAGATSGKLFEPFPEELVEILVSRWADICFCASQEEAQNLKNRNGIHVTGGNTVFDAVRHSIKLKPSAKIVKLKREKYVLFMSRRKENLFLQQRVNSILEILETILKKDFKVVWPMHANTQYVLRSKDWWPKLNKLKGKYNLEITGLFNYVDFMHAVKSAQFIVSDGGGLQSETYFLNKPMLILRRVIENEPGLNETAYLSFLDKKRVAYFLKNYRQFKRKTRIKGSPSKIIVDFFRK